ncbi:hypothetical protein [Magnetospirillum fulvum]|uniref:Uncharacterized protein n=1 Tax=Magnetospirillum fulvum TaxID=1082 RepID=A0A1H6I4W8_MAGFU|nr:hypothetical protein [Magnetospirillum fulvum]SEH43503.1 hypothetical protein SAMN04244559_02291 [Magnetospirillum fulvum]
MSGIDDDYRMALAKIPQYGAEAAALMVAKGGDVREVRSGLLNLDPTVNTMGQARMDINNNDAGADMAAAHTVISVYDYYDLTINALLTQGKLVTSEANAPAGGFIVEGESLAGTIRRQSSAVIDDLKTLFNAGFDPTVAANTSITDTTVLAAVNSSWHRAAA